MLNANFICGFGKSKLADAGIGHFKRCIILAKEFSVGKKEVNFLVYGEQTPLLNIDKEVNLQGMTAKSFNNFLDEDDIKKLRMPSSDISFIDISNSFFIKHPDNLILLLTKIRKHSRLVILIDGLGKESIINNLNIKIPYDYLIVPYFGAENEFKHQENHLLGEDYFISEKNDEKYKKFEINKNATKICITCGGTDPERITIQVLESIVKIKGISMIRVVIGPNFSKDHIDSINSLPESISNSEKWIYWKGKSLYKLEKNKEYKKALEKLSKNRSYYGFLSSHILGKPLNIVDIPYEADKNYLQELSSKFEIKR